MKRRIIQFSVAIFALIVLAVVVGTIYEVAGRRQAGINFPPPGKLVDIGGRRIQIDCRGAGTPTVVFESGLDMAGSLSWAAVHDEVAKTTQACAYSRAGIMWSEPTNANQNGKSIAEDLHAVLKNAGVAGPYVMVGHSLGGPYIMTYTKYYGDEVAGLVFVDASHPEQMQLPNGEKPAKLKLYEFGNKLGAALSWTGAVRAVTAYDQGMPNRPEWVNQAVKAYRPMSLGAMLKEKNASEETLLEAGTFRQLGNRPLFVLTAMARFSDQSLSKWKMTEVQARMSDALQMKRHVEQATWSTQSQHQLVPDAGHYIQFDRPDVVIAAVRSVVEKVRANRESVTQPKQ